mmetsp:Transcript_40276/g.115744  ORF Transcript_40276/g.115744 Transcript_40276/m.115744 type:complete len:219 (-) Transcript_40276:182-838(-)
MPGLPSMAISAQLGTARATVRATKERAAIAPMTSTAHFIWALSPCSFFVDTASGAHHFVAWVRTVPARARNVQAKPVVIQHDMPRSRSKFLLKSSAKASSSHSATGKVKFAGLVILAGRLGGRRLVVVVIVIVVASVAPPRGPSVSQPLQVCVAALAVPATACKEPHTPKLPAMQVAVGSRVPLQSSTLSAITPKKRTRLETARPTLAEQLAIWLSVS